MLNDILMTYVMYNFDLGYVQGMSDLLSPILQLLKNEVDAFWCFVGFMNKLVSMRFIQMIVQNYVNAKYHVLIFINHIYTSYFIFLSFNPIVISVADPTNVSISDFELRHRPGRHEGAAEQPTYSSRLCRSQNGRLSGQARLGQHVFLFPLVAGVVQEGTKPGGCDAAVGSTMDGVPVRELPLAGVRRHLNN